MIHLLNNRVVIGCCLVLGLLIVFDGVLTYIGIVVHNQVEGNLFLARLITTIGLIPALVLSRLFALLMLGVLYNFSDSGFSIFILLGIISAYIAFSIIPWLLVIL